MVRDHRRAARWHPPRACAICGATFQRRIMSDDDRPADVCVECQGGAAPAELENRREASAPATECPKCRTDRLVEWDAILRAFACGVCSHQWRPRLVAGALRAPRAPGLDPVPPRLD